ncbi:thiol reductant ABC exporter subunit CydD [Variovorax sp. HJSM1_2]|uniref:thiol reductant ABC exporter subunit CydD n=1 Tax=Variovorax sp. HJSM1_2 TaxID=3366263 RepID=UPI003BBA8CDB
MHQPAAKPAPSPEAPAQRLRQGVGPLLQVLASLLWIPQAGLLAYAVQCLGEGDGVASLWWPAAGVLLLGLLRAACDALGQRLVFKAARRSLSEARQRVVWALSLRSPLDAARSASGLAASVLAEQSEALLPYLTRFQPARLRSTLVPLAILAAVAPLSWVAALILLFAAPLIPLFMALVGWRAQAASAEHLGEMGGMNAFLLDRLRGLATLRALGAVERTAQQVRQSAQQLRQRTMAVLRIAFLSSAVLELFSALGVALVAVFVGFHLLGELNFGAWGERLSLGQALFVLLLAPAFFEPLRELSAVWHDRAAGQAALQAMAQLEAQGLPLTGATSRAEVAVLHGRHAPALQIEGLRFAHPGAALPVFEGLDLRVASGEHVALLAPSGAGKSTLLALLAGLAPLQAGTIHIAGVELNDATAAALRERMGWLGQRPHLFAGDVWHNIGLGAHGLDRGRAAEALQQVQLESLAQDARGLGEGGSGLSGGEAVRLALARMAAWPHRDLLLVDEPTAHLDQATADEVTDVLLALAKGKTLLVATHDPVLAARLHRSVRLQSAPSVGELEAVA